VDTSLGGREKKEDRSGKCTKLLGGKLILSERLPKLNENALA